MNEQPEALRLADMIERYNAGVHSQAIVEDYSRAAAELRRQHDRITMLEAAHGIGEKMDNFDWYTTNKYEAYKPPQQPTLRQWQELTDEEIAELWYGTGKYAPSEIRIKDFARAIEAKLREKNT